MAKYLNLVPGTSFVTACCNKPHECCMQGRSNLHTTSFKKRVSYFAVWIFLAHKHITQSVLPNLKKQEMTSNHLSAADPSSGEVNQ